MLHRRFWLKMGSRGIRLLVVVAVVGAFLFVTPSRGAADIKLAWFTVDVGENTIFGGDWFSNETLTITVHPADLTDNSTLSVATDGEGRFSKNVAFDIAPGDRIDVIDTAHPAFYSKTLLVANLVVDGISSASDIVRGQTGQAGHRVDVWLDGDTGTKRSATTDSSGWWRVEMQHDIVPGDVVDVLFFDEDGDATMVKKTAPSDSDDDGIDDVDDNCPDDLNVTQYDGDNDGKGAVCDDVDRLWGQNRYGTAAAVSRTVFVETEDTIYVASGENFPDALVAAAAARHEWVPVLLTTKTSLPQETRDEIIRLQPKKVYIVGGTAVISPAVERQIRSLGPTVKRLAGADRYETAAAVSREVLSAAFDVYIALGTNFPDALVAAAAAGANNDPVLLTPKDHLPRATINELKLLKPSEIMVVGGPAAISDTVVEQLRPLASKGVKRLAGANRYETAAAVAEEGFGWANRVFLAYGGDFPDALVAAAAGGGLWGPVLLVTHDAIPAATRNELDHFKPAHDYVVGGTAVIGDKVFNALP